MQDHERCEKNRGALELQRSFELTMLAALGAEVLVLARCAVGGGWAHLAGGAEGWGPAWLERRPNPAAVGRSYSLFLLFHLVT
jgi:hypothetical protein